MFFQGWSGLWRVLVVGTLAYITLIILLRISGKRTLAKLNAFDFVVTVALGSTLATILLNNSIALAEGVLALALLIGLQYSISWLSVRSEGFQELIKSEPTLLVHRGRFLESALRSQRLSREEVLAAVRSDGHARLEDVGAVVLETDGTISIITGSDLQPSDTALKTVNGFERTCLHAQAPSHNDDATGRSIDAP
ncbi:DUF421 domain-containing protein [Microvirga arabica]|uniref:DUF421 domain-containing protein n=1 Tax=Microvirga arabica TaxID=1128671 RepID=A0ABV6YFX8_9HYPH|nr:YetF domain-containing protein [Microvirga arabica]MBM1172352.1 DUF421 domain-containing protein [Microvirga arabica]